MEKKALIFIIIGLILLFVGTGLIANNIAYRKTEEINNTGDSEANTVKEETDIELKNDYLEKYTMIDEFDNYLGYCDIYDDKIIYVNEEYGFQITLPASWNRHFKVRKSKMGDLVFYYMCKSDIAYISKDNFNRGLIVFFIVKESELKDTIDDPHFIGIANDIEYYYGTTTGCETEELANEIIDYERGESDYQDNPEQIELIKEDLAVWERMEGDFDYTELDFQPLK